MVAGAVLGVLDQPPRTRGGPLKSRRTTVGIRAIPTSVGKLEDVVGNMFCVPSNPTHVGRFGEKEYECKAHWNNPHIRGAIQCPVVVAADGGEQSPRTWGGLCA